MNMDEAKKQYESLPEEVKETYRRKIDFLTKIMPLVLSARAKGGNPSMLDAMEMGSASMEYCREFECSPMDFLNDLKSIEQVFIRKSIEHGDIAFGDCHAIPDDLKNKNNQNKKRIEDSYEKPSTASIGDMLKAKGVKI
jgi:hypothetical protein